MVRTFELLYPKTKYTSDLWTFVREANLEDFYKSEQNTIAVSTMHKAKGREFDQVFLLLNNFQRNIGKEEKKRLLYVALTRAKSRLNIHLNGNYLDRFTAEHLVVEENTTLYDAPSELVLNVTHKDLFLDQFLKRDAVIAEYTCGDNLPVVNGELIYKNGHPPLRFSQKFNEQLLKFRNDGYELTSARIKFIVYWQKADTEMETRIFLPELRMKKILTNVTNHNENIQN